MSGCKKLPDMDRMILAVDCILIAGIPRADSDTRGTPLRIT